MKRIWEKPLAFGVFYALNIVFFSLLYRYKFANDFKNMDEGIDFVQALYFSVVSVTTLGFGDITPNLESDGLLVSVIVQVILGILIVGLFLNAISHKISTNRENEINETIRLKELELRTKSLKILKPIVMDQLSVLADIYKSTSAQVEPESFTVEPKEFFDSDYYNQVCLIDYYSKNTKYGQDRMIGEVVIKDNSRFTEGLESYLTKFSHTLSIEIVSLINDIQTHQYFQYPKTSLQMYSHIYKVNNGIVENRHMIANEHDVRIPTNKNMPLHMREFHQKLLKLIFLIDEHLPEDKIKMEISLVKHISPQPGSAIGKFLAFGDEDKQEVDSLLA